MAVLTRASLGAWLLFMTSTAMADDAMAPDQAIRALPGGGSNAWDDAVMRLLVRAYDDDDSGRLDRVDELTRVPCEVWHAVDAGVRAGWGASLHTIYGFHPEGSWEGGRIGLDDVLREQAALELEACGVHPEAFGIRPGQGSVSVAIQALPGGGSDRWDAAVQRVLVEAFDTDGSGAVDTGDEVASIPCEVWQSIDRGVRNQYPAGLYITYGFSEPGVWVGSALGIDGRMRRAASAAVIGCGVEGARELPELPRDPLLLARALGQLTEPGSTAWTSVVRLILLRGFDEDKSGEIDTADEVRGIPCEAVHALDGPLQDAQGVGLIEGYGFDPDGRWAGYAIGFEGALRAVAADHLTQCLADPTAGPLARGDDGPGGPDGLLVHDADGSGRIDARSEVVSVPCDAWLSLELVTRHAFGVGFLELYGFHRGAVWAGDELHLDGAWRGLIRRRVHRCGID